MLRYNSFLYWIAVTGKNKHLLTDKALKGPLISKEITMFDIGGKILHRSSNINYHRESFFNIWMNRCGLAVWTKPSLGEGIRKAQTYLWMTTSLGFILARTFHHWKENQKSHYSQILYLYSFPLKFEVAPLTRMICSTSRILISHWQNL